MIDKLVELNYKFTGLSGPFALYGSFGIIDGDAKSLKNLQELENAFIYETNEFKVVCEYKIENDGIVVREDKFINKSNKPLVINKYVSRFFLPFYDADVYTQYSSWQNESDGAWQKLVNTVSCSNAGIRTTDGATPMTAILDNQTGKTKVFHLFPNSSWKIAVRKKPYYGKESNILVEIGINNDNPLALTVEPYETIEFGKIVYFDVHNKVDFDAYKLHKYYNLKYPRKELPILYNSWLSNFFELDFDETIKQIDRAKYLGFEYFVIDCGWYGDGEVFFENVGRWYESENYGYKGRLQEIANYVNLSGMKFGLWFELERAYEGVESVKNHPEYYLSSGDGDYFLNFGDDKARNFIFEEVCKVIDKYNLGFMKFDFNRTISFDATSQGFYRYQNGYKKFIQMIKDKYSNMYITSCAGGGNRLELEQLSYMDSAWFSDNNGQLEGLDILKKCIFRLPSSVIERWGVYTFSSPIPKILQKENHTVPLICNNASWENLATVSEDYIFSFLTGGPFGLSCNLLNLPSEHVEKLKNYISLYKEQREFYKSANVRVIIDDKNIVAFEYFDNDFNNIVIKVFTKNINQTRITIYPFMDKNAKYSYDEKIFTASELDMGIVLKELTDFNVKTIELKKV